MLPVNGDKESVKVSLIGIWQDAPVIGSGWSNVYRFYDSGKFIFNPNQMECDKRELERTGMWRIDGNSLILEIRTRTVLKGGKRVEATGSCGSDGEIEGGREFVEKLKKPKIIKMKIGNLYFDREFKHSVIMLNGKRYWKHRDDPDDYR